MHAAKARFNRWLAVSLVLALGALAMNGGRIWRAIDGLFAPPPPHHLIIVAPTDSDTV